MGIAKSLLLSLTILALTACASSARIPAQHYQLPETTGKLFKGTVQLGSQGVMEGTMYHLSLDGSKDMETEVFGNSDMLLAGHLGLLKSLDVYLQASSSGTTTNGLKWQFLGKAAPESTRGDFSAAVFAGVGWGESEQGVSDNLFDREAKSEIEQSLWEVGLSVGYRITPQLLTYGTLARTEFKATDTYNLKEFSTGNSLVSDETLHGDGDLTSFGMGLSWGVRWRLVGELTYSEMNWRHDASTSKVKGDKIQYSLGSSFHW